MSTINGDNIGGVFLNNVFPFRIHNPNPRWLYWDICKSREPVTPFSSNYPNFDGGIRR